MEVESATKANNKDVPCKGKMSKKERERQNYRRQKEAENLKEQLLQKLQQNAEKEQKRLEKEAAERKAVAKLKKESLMAQASVAVKDGKKNKAGKTQEVAIDNTKIYEASAVHDSIEKNEQNNEFFDDSIWDEGCGSETATFEDGACNSAANFVNHAKEVPAGSRRGGYRGNHDSYEKRSNSSYSGSFPNNTQRSISSFNRKDGQRGNNRNRGRGGNRSKSQNSSHNGSGNFTRSSSKSESSCIEEERHFRKDLNVDAPQPNINIWQQRQAKKEFIEELCPNTDHEEEAMLHQAMELSRRQVVEDEKRRRALAEEYELQQQYLIDHPHLVLDSSFTGAGNFEHTEKRSHVVDRPGNSSTYCNSDYWDDNQNLCDDDGIWNGSSNSGAKKFTRGNANAIKPNSNYADRRKPPPPQISDDDGTWGDCAIDEAGDLKAADISSSHEKVSTSEFDDDWKCGDMPIVSQSNKNVSDPKTDKKGNQDHAIWSGSSNNGTNSWEKNDFTVTTSNYNYPFTGAAASETDTRLCKDKNLHATFDKSSNNANRFGSQVNDGCDADVRSDPISTPCYGDSLQNGKSEVRSSSGYKVHEESSPYEGDAEASLETVASDRLAVDLKRLKEDKPETVKTLQNTMKNSSCPDVGQNSVDDQDFEQSYHERRSDYVNDIGSSRRTSYIDTACASHSGSTSNNLWADKFTEDCHVETTKDILQSNSVNNGIFFPNNRSDNIVARSQGLSGEYKEKALDERVSANALSSLPKVTDSVSNVKKWLANTHSEGHLLKRSDSDVCEKSESYKEKVSTTSASVSSDKYVQNAGWDFTQMIHPPQETAPIKPLQSVEAQIKDECTQFQSSAVSENASANAQSNYVPLQNIGMPFAPQPYGMCGTPLMPPNPLIVPQMLYSYPFFMQQLYALQMLNPYGLTAANSYIPQPNVGGMLQPNTLVQSLPPCPFVPQGSETSPLGFQDAMNLSSQDGANSSMSSSYINPPVQPLDNSKFENSQPYSSIASVPATRLPPGINRSSIQSGARHNSRRSADAFPDFQGTHNLRGAPSNEDDYVSIPPPRPYLPERRAYKTDVVRQPKHKFNDLYPSRECDDN